MILLVLLLILITDSTSNKYRSMNDYTLVHISKTEVLVPLGNETLLLSDSLTKGVDRDTCLILDGKEFMATKDSDERTVEYLQRSTFDNKNNPEQLRVVGVISLEDADRLTDNKHGKRNKLIEK